MRLFGKDSEQILAGRLRNGEPGAMQEFYNLYAAGLAAVCSRYIGNNADREDVFQDCLVSIISHIGDFKWRGPGSLRAWAMRIAANRSLTFLKEKRRTELYELNDDTACSEEDEQDPETDDIPACEIQRMIMELPTGYRTVLNLYALENKSHREIAELLGIKEMSSASQLHRAKKLLAEKIRKYRADKERI